jgi:hypothetical protein
VGQQSAAEFLSSEIPQPALTFLSSSEKAGAGVREPYRCKHIRKGGDSSLCNLLIKFFEKFS